MVGSMNFFSEGKTRKRLSCNDASLNKFARRFAMKCFMFLEYDKKILEEMTLLAEVFNNFGSLRNT